MKIIDLMLVVIFIINIESVIADWPRYTQCPEINSNLRSNENNKRNYNSFIFYSSNKTNSSIKEKFLGATLNSEYVFSCKYMTKDGNDVSAIFELSKCSAHHGFNNSGECNNTDPDQCMAVCSY